MWNTYFNNSNNCLNSESWNVVIFYFSVEVDITIFEGFFYIFWYNHLFIYNNYCKIRVLCRISWLPTHQQVLDIIKGRDSYTSKGLGETDFSTITPLPWGNCGWHLAPFPCQMTKAYDSGRGKKLCAFMKSLCLE